MVLFATLLALLGGLVAAPAPGYADPNPWTDWPQVAAPGDELAITINMYRFRYTVSPPSPIVKWETNVAAFPFQHNGKDMVIVTNNIGRFPNNPKIAYIDLVGWPGGISPPGSHRSVRNSLPLHGSCRPGHLAGRFHPGPVGEVPRPGYGHV